MELNKHGETLKAVNVRDHIHRRGPMFTPRSFAVFVLIIIVVVSWAFLWGATMVGIADAIEWLGAHILIGVVVGFVVGTLFWHRLLLRVRSSRRVRDTVLWMIGTENRADSSDAPENG